MDELFEYRLLFISNFISRIFIVSISNQFVGGFGLYREVFYLYGCRFRLDNQFNCGLRIGLLVR